MSSPESNFDAWLDAELRNVPAPAGLLHRLEQIAALSDEELDAALREVPIPADLASRLERIGRRQVRLAEFRHWAAAAALWLAVGLGYLGLVLSFVAGLLHAPETRQPVQKLMAEFTAPEPEPDLGVLAEDFDWAAVFAAREPAPPVPNLPLPKADPLVAKDIGRIGLETAGGDLLADVTLARWPIAGAYNGYDEVEEIWKVPGMKPRGMDFPLVFGYDLVFLSRTGFHPFVRPAINPQLATLVAPLAVDTESYELARRCLEAGELPPRSELRTEEFLAAMDYQFPRPTKEALGLFLAGGPSPVRGNTFQLFQVGVQAREISQNGRPPSRLTLAIDVSGSMGWGGRLDIVRQALGRLLERLNPDDRVSLVAFHSEGTPLIEDAGLQQRDQILASLESLRASGSTNVVAGLRSAYAVALREKPPAQVTNAVVLLTDGLTGLDPGTTARLDASLTEAAARGASLHVVDLSQEREDEELDGRLSRLASKGGGRAFRATSTDQVRWALEEILAGKPQRVATDARLRITFNPKAVAVYRIFGHEPRTIAAIKPAHVQADFHAGQAATVLFEMVLIPDGSSEIALAELTWRDPRDGESHRASQTLHRGQFATSLLQAPFPLQAAAIVAEAAEILRGSPFVAGWPAPGSLEPVLQAGHQVDTRLLDRPSYAAFLALLEKAPGARPYRSGGDARVRPAREGNK